MFNPNNGIRPSKSRKNIRIRGIAPLSAAGFFCLYDNTPASFMQIVREFEIMCNTRMKNPGNSRWAILNSKNKLTHFPDILRNTRIELSQR